MNKQLIACDHCTNDVEVAIMLTSQAPYGERVICEDCRELPKFKHATLYHLRTMFAWKEYNWADIS